MLFAARSTPPCAASRRGWPRVRRVAAGPRWRDAVAGAEGQRRGASRPTRPLPGPARPPGSVLGHCRAGLTCHRDAQSRVFHSGQLPRFGDKQRNRVWLRLQRGGCSAGVKPSQFSGKISHMVSSTNHNRKDQIHPGCISHTLNGVIEFRDKSGLLWWMPKDISREIPEV